MVVRYLVIVSLTLAAFVGCSSSPTQNQASEEGNATTAENNDAAKANRLNSSSVRSDSLAKAAPLNSKDPLLSVRSIYYDLDNYQIKNEYKSMVQAHASYLKSHEKTTIQVQGNCDERGSREYNLALGQRRAESVKNMLTILGVSEEQVEAISFGEEKPFALGHDERSWTENRRSDLIYSGKK